MTWPSRKRPRLRAFPAVEGHQAHGAQRTLDAWLARRTSWIPTGRVRRTAKVGGLAGGQTARNYATKAANLTRGEEARREAAERRQTEAAEQIVDVLGQR